MSIYDTLEDLDLCVKEKPSHVSIHPAKSYYMDGSDLKTFIKLYSKTKDVKTFAEIPNEYSMLTVDYDIKEEGIKLKQLYDIELVKKVVSRLFEIINDLEIHSQSDDIKYNKDEHITSTLFVKDPYITMDGKYIKHGFHLQCLLLFFNSESRRYILSKLKQDFPNVDVCYKNPWYMYGSSKDKRFNPYLLSNYTFTSKNEIIDSKEYISKHFKDLSLVEVCSINRPSKNILAKIKIEKDEKVIVKRPSNINNGDLKQASSLLDLIDSKYSDDYKSWNAIGMALYTIGEGSEESFQLWNEFSKRTTIKGNYKEHVCSDKWSKFTKDMYTIGTLHYYAKENPNYNKVVATFPKTGIYNDKLRITGKKFKCNSDYFYDIKMTENIYIIKAYLGAGKTTSIIKFIKTLHKDISILVLTPRIAFSQTILYELNKNDLKFNHYQDKKQLKSDRLVIQVESLHKITKNYDFVIMDECESILTQLSADTLKADRKKIYNIVSHIFKNSKIIMADAFISNKTFDFLNDMKVKYEYHEHTKPPLERKCIEFEYSREHKIIDSLINDLEANKKIYFIFSARKKLIKVKNIITNRFGNKIKIKDYHSENDNKIQDIKKDWKDVDLVMTTTTITVGCNFDEPNVFHKVYIYMSASSNNIVRDIFQSHMRVRHLIDNELVYTLDTIIRPLDKYYISRKSIIENVDNIKEILCECYPENFKDMTIPFQNLYYNNRQESAISVIFLEKTFKQYLDKCGYSNTSYEQDFELDKSLDKKIDDVNYREIKQISELDYQSLCKKRNICKLNKDEILQLLKFQFTNIVSGLNEKQEEKAFKKFYIDKHKRSIFYNIKYDKSTTKYEDIKTRNDVDIYHKFYQEKYKIMCELKKELGMKNSIDEVKFTREKIESIIPLLENNEKLIFTIWNLNIDSSVKDVQWAINILDALFNTWCKTRVKRDTERKRVRINGKRIEVSGFYIKPNTIVKNYLYDSIQAFNSKQRMVMQSSSDFQIQIVTSKQ